MNVTLTWAEIIQGAMRGVMRRTSELKRGTKPYAGIDREAGWNPDIEGALGEMAVARYLNVFWDASVETIGGPDVGFVEVRTTTYDDGRLILREKDLAEKPFVLVIAKTPVFSLRGWIYAREGKREEFLSNGGNGRPKAFFVPQQVLRPMEQLLTLRTNNEQHTRRNVPLLSQNQETVHVHQND